MRTDSIVSRLIGLCEGNNSVKKHAAGIYDHSTEICVGTNTTVRTRYFGENHVSMCAECCALNSLLSFTKKKYRVI